MRLSQALQKEPVKLAPQKGLGERSWKTPIEINAFKIPVKEKVDLLLTDLVMPGGVNGRQLADVLRGQSPKLKVVYMSGYSADVLGKEFTVQPGIDFLQKPYGADRLATVIRDSLDARAR